MVTLKGTENRFLHSFRKDGLFTKPRQFSHKKRKIYRFTRVHFSRFYFILGFLILFDSKVCYGQGKLTNYYQLI